MAFVIKSEVSRRIVAGVMKEEEFHYVADETGALVGKKAHGTLAEAEHELSGLKGLEEGLEFAKAQFPELGQKAQVGKANVVAEFLSWVANGKPVKDAEADAAAETAEGQLEDHELSDDEAF